MSNSSLVDVTILSPNHSGKRTHAIDTITVHTMACNGAVTTLGNNFAKSATKASSNYGVDSKGQIGLYVDECNRSWCTSSSANDQRAVTIEVASITNTEPFACTEAAWDALVTLVADICKRNSIKKLVWSTDKTTRVNHLNGCNMTVHRDYAAKSCPGTYLYENMGRLAKEVNAILNEKDDEMTVEKFTELFNQMMLNMAKEPCPEWAKKEWQEAVDMGITDGSRPMQMIPRVQAAIMAKRAVEAALKK